MFPPALLYTAFFIFFLVCFFCVFLLITCVPLQIFSGQLLPLFLSSPLLSVAACLQPEAAVAAPLAITPQERETHGHDSHVNTHTHAQI